MNTSPFVIFALPRSRTAWLSLWLSHGGMTCGHDEVIGRGSIAEFAQHLRTLRGSIETGAIIGWRALRRELPASRFLVLRRSPADVAVSLARAGIPLSSELLEELSVRDALLDQLACERNVVSLEWTDLGSAGTCAWLMEELLGMDFDPERWHRLSALNVQIDMEARMGALVRHEGGLLAIRAEVASGPRDLGAH